MVICQFEICLELEQGEKIPQFYSKTFDKTKVRSIRKRSSFCQERKRKFSRFIDHCSQSQPTFSCWLKLHVLIFRYKEATGRDVVTITKQKLGLVPVKTSSYRCPTSGTETEGSIGAKNKSDLGAIMK